MKSIIFLFVALIGSVCFSSSKILSYRYGNQITGSILLIYDDGALVHYERTCCPPRTDHIEEKPLDAISLSYLLHLIAGASKGEQISYSAGTSGNGSSAGTLTAFSSQGNQINIRTIEFDSLNGSPQPVQKNSTPEAREIEEVVFSIVKQKMKL